MGINLQKTLALLGALLCAMLFWVLMAWAGVTILSGCQLWDYRKKVEAPPAPPKRTEAQEEGLRQNAGVIQTIAIRADQRGVGPATIESGTLKRAADAQIATLGQPAKAVNVDDPKAISALISAMADQELTYRQDKAAWEDKIDAMSRQRDQYRTEATSLSSAVGKLKAWLFWGSVLLVVGCILCPGLLWFLVRFFTGRVRAHLGQVVEGVESFMDKSPQSAEALKDHLSKRMDTTAKRIVKQIKIDRGI